MRAIAHRYGGRVGIVRNAVLDLVPHPGSRPHHKLREFVGIGRSCLVTGGILHSEICLGHEILMRSADHLPGELLVAAGGGRDLTLCSLGKVFIAQTLGQFVSDGARGFLHVLVLLAFEQFGPCEHDHAPDHGHILGLVVDLDPLVGILCALGVVEAERSAGRAAVGRNFGLHRGIVPGLKDLRHEGFIAVEELVGDGIHIQLLRRLLERRILVQFAQGGVEFVNHGFLGGRVQSLGVLARNPLLGEGAHGVLPAAQEAVVLLRQVAVLGGGHILHVLLDLRRLFSDFRLQGVVFVEQFQRGRRGGVARSLQGEDLRAEFLHFFQADEIALRHSVLAKRNLPHQIGGGGLQLRGVERTLSRVGDILATGFADRRLQLLDFLGQFRLHLRTRRGGKFVEHRHAQAVAGGGVHGVRQLGQARVQRLLVGQVFLCRLQRGLPLGSGDAETVERGGEGRCGFQALRGIQVFPARGLQLAARLAQFERGLHHPVTHARLHCRLHHFASRHPGNLARPEHLVHVLEHQSRL